MTFVQLQFHQSQKHLKGLGALISIFDVCKANLFVGFFINLDIPCENFTSVDDKKTFEQKSLIDFQFTLFALLTNSVCIGFSSE